MTSCMSRQKPGESFNQKLGQKSSKSMSSTAKQSSVRDQVGIRYVPKGLSDIFISEKYVFLLLFSAS